MVAPWGHPMPGAGRDPDPAQGAGGAALGSPLAARAREEQDGAASSRGTVSQRGVFCRPRPYQSDPSFDPEFIMSKSTAAAGLCSWCLNIVRFYEVYCEVEPKRLALAEANAELAEAQEKLTRIKNKIAVSACPRHSPGQGGCRSQPLFTSNSAVGHGQK